MKYLVAAGIGGLLVFSVWTFFAEVQTISSYAPTSWTEDHAADCAVVLTGGPGRVREGFDLLAQGNVRKLIISGVHPGAGLREIFPEWPFYGNLNKEDVILERRSLTTYGNAQQSLVFVEALQCRDLVLITSNLHMHRASHVFASVFPKDFTIYQRSIIGRQLDPTWWELMVEAMKSLFYSIWAY